MSQSLTKNYIHTVFSTKYRQHLIHEPIASELHRYIGGTCKSLECYPVIVGGYTDHIHILSLLSKKIALMKFVELVKSHSSKWIKTKDETLSNFYWQDGYGAFSVGYTQVDWVKGYIENQAQHHQKKNFQDEYRQLLKDNEQEYDERYVWD